MSLSEGIVHACDFFGLKVPDNQNADFPSDIFGENFEPDLNILRRAKKLSEKSFSKSYDSFTRKYSTQISLKQNSTDKNIYFCDYLLNARKNHAVIDDYFDFEFYKKSSDEQKTFRLQIHREQTRIICNDYAMSVLLDNKIMTVKKFSDFVHRDWLDSTKCSLEEFKNFLVKNPKFFAKPVFGSFGKNTVVFQVGQDVNAEKLLDWLRVRKCIIEGLIVQHDLLKEFCPDTLNTIRVNTLVDVHGTVHILTAGGRFGRVGKIVDNFHGGGFSAVIDTETGIIISDGINKIHERLDRHPDTGKIFKGFQYPYWNELRIAVKRMAKVIPQVKHIGWDIAINSAGQIELVEANANPDVDVQQAPDSVGRLHLYTPFIDEWKNYKNAQIKILGYKNNNLKNFYRAYEEDPVRQERRLKILFGRLIDNCQSVIDVGCRKNKFIKTLCAEDIKYLPIDFVPHDEEVIACDLNKNFPDLRADTCICALTAEYIENLPQFLKNICNAADKQILMLCRPVDKEIYDGYRWNHPFLTDFTEKFLIDSMQKNNFRLQSLLTDINNSSVITYDFRKI